MVFFLIQKALIKNIDIISLFIQFLIYIMKLCLKEIILT